MKKRQIIIIALLLLSMCFSFGCSKKFKTTTPSEAKALIDQGAIVVDVRYQDEYAEGHIKNAILMPVDEIESKANSILPDKNANIIVYCRSGNRSRTAANILVKLGYKNIYDLGSYFNWVNKGYEVE